MSRISKYAAKARLQKYADEASSSYLQDKAPLNESIKKLAYDNNLNTEEINRVCEASNQSVYADLFSKLEDKTFAFPLADSGQIIEDINKEASAVPVPGMERYQAVDVVYHDEHEKVASADDEVLGDMPIIFGANETQRKSVFLEKLATIENNFKQELVKNEIEKEEAFLKFCADAKQMVLGDGVQFHEIYHNLVDARPELYKKAAVMLKATALQMGKTFEITQFEKTAEMEVDPKLISTGMSFSGRPLKVINGRQTLLVQLDTLIKQDADYTRLRHGLDVVGDKVKYLKTSLSNTVAEDLRNG